MPNEKVVMQDAVDDATANVVDTQEAEKQERQRLKRVADFQAEMERSKRKTYVGDHAPTIAAGMLGDPSASNVDAARIAADSVELAAALFDATQKL